MLLDLTADGVDEPHYHWKSDGRRGRNPPMVPPMRLVEECRRKKKPLDEALKIARWLEWYAYVTYGVEPKRGAG